MTGNETHVTIKGRSLTLSVDGEFDGFAAHLHAVHDLTQMIPEISKIHRFHAALHVCTNIKLCTYYIF